MIKEERRKQRQRKKNRQRLFILLLVLFLLVGIGYVLVTQVYCIEEVQVVGNELYTDEQIEQVVLNDEYSWSSLYVYMKYRFGNPGQVAFIDTMDIKLTSPSTLTIQVYEKGILGYLYISALNQYAYFDKDGFVVETSQEKIKDIPEVSGLTCDSVVLYERLPIQEKEALSTLLTLTQLLDKYQIQAKNIHYDENGSMTVSNGKVDILLGGAEYLPEKVMRLQYIIPQLGKKKGVLHLENWTTETTDIIFSPR